MLKTLKAIIHGGKIEPLEKIDLPEGAKVLVRLLPDDETEFWHQVSETSLNTVWDNPKDDIYAQLLNE